MSRAKKVLVAGGTFCVALGIGFVMQNGDALAARFGADAPPPADLGQPMAQAIPQGPVLPLPTPETGAAVALPQRDGAPALTAPPVRLAAAGDPDLGADSLPVQPAQPLAVADCTATMTAVARPAAMVDLSLDAPCTPDAVVTLHHQGMMFTGLTDATGHLDVTVPALSVTAVFMADFKTGTGAVASTEVPDLATFDRAVLQWQGADGFALHAYEFGAGFGDAGHIWTDAPGVVQTALDGSGGFLVRLGDSAVPDPLMAEVYTFPIGTIRRDGDVTLTAEAAVTDQTCGRDVSAQSIQITAAGDPTALDLTMTMPGCDAVGEYLEIKPMFEDISVAVR